MKLLDLLAVSHPEEELDGPTVHTFLTAFEAVAPRYFDRTLRIWKPHDLRLLSSQSRIPLSINDFKKMRGRDELGQVFISAAWADRILEARRRNGCRTCEVERPWNRLFGGPGYGVRVFTDKDMSSFFF